MKGTKCTTCFCVYARFTRMRGYDMDLLYVLLNLHISLNPKKKTRIFFSDRSEQPPAGPSGWLVSTTFRKMVWWFTLHLFLGFRHIRRVYNNNRKSSRIWRWRREHDVVKNNMVRNSLEAKTSVLCCFDKRTTKT